MNAIPIIRVARVVSIDDKQGGDRIKVELLPEDNAVENIENQPVDAFPLLPKIFHIKPAVNETVLVITALANNGYSQRYYIGPVFSQENKIPGENHYTSSRSLLDNSDGNVGVNPRIENNAKGCYPDDMDISINGRENADIQIKKNDIRIRCGVKKLKNDKSNFNFNTSDPAYIKLQYYQDGLPDYNVLKNNQIDRCNSTINIVADKINILGNDSKEKFITTDNTDLITDSQMKLILEKAHKLPYGDILVDFLSLLRTCFVTHTHPFSMLPPVRTTSIENLDATNLKDMLSDSVRIN